MLALIKYKGAEILQAQETLIQDVEEELRGDENKMVFGHHVPPVACVPGIHARVSDDQFRVQPVEEHSRCKMLSQQRGSGRQDARLPKGL